MFGTFAVAVKADAAFQTVSRNLGVVILAEFGLEFRADHLAEGLIENVAQEV